jgi:hypothetical protein
MSSETCRDRSSRKARRLLPSLEACEARALMAASPLRIASLGDSITDEYVFYGPDRTAARNWPMILSALRPAEVDFGAFSTTTRGETRNQGYAQNWARSGAQATPGQPDVAGAGTTFVEQYQGGFTPGTPGLLTQPGGLNNVDAVTILIGANDFLHAFESAVLEPQSTSLAGNIFSNLITATAGVVQGVTDAITALQAARPDLPIVLGVTPNITDTALFDDLTELLPASDVAALDQLVDGFIADIKNAFTALASPTLTVIDPNELFARFTAQGDTIQGLKLNPDSGGPVVTDLFVGDSFHPGTIAQGLLANGFLGGLATLLPGQGLTPLSDAEIVALAQQVQPTTQATLAASAAVVPPGSAATFTATVATFATPVTTPGPGPFPAPTGTVTFFDASAGNTLLGIATLDATGTATLTTSALTEGAHSIVASYSGNTVYPAAVTTTAQVVVGTPHQAQLIGLVQVYQERLGQQVASPLLARWDRWLARGVRPERIARTIYHRVGHQPFPRALPTQALATPRPRALAWSRSMD